MKWIVDILLCTIGAVVAALLINKNCPKILLYVWGIFVGSLAQVILNYDN